MQVTLSPHGEELLAAALARGLGSSPEEIIERALETVAEQAAPTAERKKTPAEAVAHIRESRQGVTLGEEEKERRRQAVDAMRAFSKEHHLGLGPGERIKDLIHEGHKY